MNASTVFAEGPSEADALGAPLDLSINAVAMGQMLRYSVLIADRAAVSDIEVEGVQCQVEGSTHRWYDVRPMLDEREHSMECIDMNQQSLVYAEQRRLIQRHTAQRHLVRILRSY